MARNRDDFELHCIIVRPSNDSQKDEQKNLTDSRSIRYFFGDLIDEVGVGHFAVSVLSGAVLKDSLSCYAIEQVQAFLYPKPKIEGRNMIVSLLRQRMFRFDEPVTKGIVPRLSEVTPRQPYIEWLFNVEEEMVNFALICPSPKSEEEHKRFSRTVRQMYEEVYTKDLVDQEQGIGIADKLRSNAGRKPKAEIDQETVPLWSGVYTEALTLIRSQLLNRKRKQLARYKSTERKLIIKRAFPALDDSIAEALSMFKSPEDVALRYTGLICSEIEIGTWKTTRYQNIRRESDKINGITRRGKQNGAIE